MLFGKSAGGSLGMSSVGRSLLVLGLGRLGDLFLVVGGIVLRCSFLGFFLGIEAFSLLPTSLPHCGKLVKILLEVVRALDSDRKSRFGTRLDAHDSDVAPSCKNVHTLCQP